jgi:predicted nucleotidyltransferase
MIVEDIFDLEAIIKIIAGKFSEVESVYLFGSRRFETGSSRSDIDILLELNNPLKPSKLRDLTLEHCTALDLFILENGRATSVANESYIQYKNNEELIKSVNAILLYDKTNGVNEELAKRKDVEVDKRINHQFTSLPNETADYYEISALRKIFKKARENGLTAKPYLGCSTDEVSEFIIEILKGIIPSSHSVTNYGQAKDGWTKSLSDEYDFQNLFWIATKPWLPNLSREEVEIKYDGQEKRSDFSLFNHQLVIELKHIKNDGDKRIIVKTLEGLKEFYVKHPNIRVLIFGILVDEIVRLDDRKWETDYSYADDQPVVKTIIIRNKE